MDKTSIIITILYGCFFVYPQKYPKINYDCILGYFRVMKKIPNCEKLFKLRMLI